MASSDAAAVEDLHDQIRRCPRCQLSRSRTKAVPGEGSLEAAVMFVGEAPGRDEDHQGRPFIGPAGRLLTDLLRTIGLDRKDVFITNIVKCRPPENRDPLPEEIEACNEYLLTQIALITPKVICTLGRFAGQTLIDPRLGISRDHGKATRVSGILYVPLYHPAAALHQARLMDTLRSDMRQLKTILDRELADSPGFRSAAGGGSRDG